MQNDILATLTGRSDAELVARTVRRLAPHLTPANHREVLESARGKRKTEVEEIVAKLSPQPDVPTSIRRLPVPRPEVPRPVLSPPAAHLAAGTRAQAPGHDRC